MAFLKLTRMNANGDVVGPIWVNIDQATAIHPYSDIQGLTQIDTGVLLIVKETPEQIIDLHEKRSS